MSDPKPYRTGPQPPFVPGNPGYTPDIVPKPTYPMPETERSRLPWGPSRPLDPGDGKPFRVE